VGSPSIFLRTIQEHWTNILLTGLLQFFPALLAAMKIFPRPSSSLSSPHAFAKSLEVADLHYNRFLGDPSALY
jgi:hypothetical protein